MVEHSPRVNTQNRASRSAWGFPQFDGHIPPYIVKYVLQNTFLTYNLTAWYHLRFQICDKCSFESSFSSTCLVYIHLPLWRHRACMATYSLNMTTSSRLNWSWWHRTHIENESASQTVYIYLDHLGHYRGQLLHYKVIAHFPNHRTEIMNIHAGPYK